MSDLIRTLDLNTDTLITSRDVYQTEVVRSINIDQTNGNFVITKPLNEEQPVVVYPQSPDNPSYSSIGEIKYLYSIPGFGFLDFVLDAKFDFSRGKLWMADAGNQRVLRVNSSTFRGEIAINNIVLPCAICPDLNNGGVFVRAFTDVDNGAIHYYSYSGELITTVNFPISPAMSSITINRTAAFIDALPLQTSMAFDHIRSKLWWTNQTFVYMMDTKNKQIISKDLSISAYVATKGLDIDASTGNCFVVATSSANQDRVIQISRDNSEAVSASYVLEV